MQHAAQFPEGIHIPGLKPVKLAALRPNEFVRQPCESDFPELNVRELSILMLKQRGQK